MKKYRGKLWSLFLNIWKTSNLILTEKTMKLVSVKEIVQTNGKKEKRPLAASIIKGLITPKIFVRSAKNKKNEKSRTNPSKSKKHL